MLSIQTWCLVALMLSNLNKHNNLIIIRSKIYNIYSFVIFYLIVMIYVHVLLPSQTLIPLREGAGSLSSPNTWAE